MGKRLRHWKSNRVYTAVERTVDRTFLFRPDHQPDHPLLRWDSDPRALDLKNDLIPKPSIINIIGSSLVRAQKDNPIELMWAEGNINHIHTGLHISSDEDLGLSSDFKRDSNSLIGLFTNKTHQREGHMLTAPFRAEPCLDDLSAEQQLLYAVTNVVKDSLVDKVSHSPFFSTYDHFAHGDPLNFWWIEWRKYLLAGGARNKKLHPKDFLEWGELELTCLPEWEGLNEHQRQTRFRHGVAEIEEEHRELRRNENRTVIGVPALYSLDPRDRPKNPQASTPQPLCHTVSSKTRRAFKKQWREFVYDHGKASWDYLDGHYDREFPDGSFRPPITTIYHSSHL